MAGRADIGRRLTAARVAASRTVRDLAAEVGRPSSTVGGWLNGKHLPVARDEADFVRVLALVGLSGADADDVVEAVRRLRQRPHVRRTNPYRGLQPYGPDDHELFFGRAAWIERISSALSDQHGGAARPLVITGPSGVGKTSLLRAGIGPRLADGGVVVRYLDCSVDPGGQLDALCQLDLEGELETRGQLGTTDRIDTADGIGTADRIDTGDRIDTARASPVVWLIDQFEQLVDAEAASRDELLQRIEAAAQHDHIAVAVTVRADFVAPLVELPTTAAWLNERFLVVEAPAGDDLRECVLGPAEHAGWTIEPHLLIRLVEDFLLATDVRRTSALPLLSFVLRSIADSTTGSTLTAGAYDATGGLAGALARTAETALATVAPAQARAALLPLLRLDQDGRVTRRSVRIDSLDADRRAALEPFVRQRLVSADATHVTFTHEAVLTSWPRLEGWIGEHQHLLRRARQVSTARTWWEAAERDPGTLLSGSLLDDVAPLLDEASGVVQLDAADRDFIAASVERRRRQRAATRAAQAAQAAGHARLLMQSDRPAAAHVAAAAVRIADTVPTRSALIATGSAPGQRFAGPPGAARLARHGEMLAWVSPAQTGVRVLRDQSGVLRAVERIDDDPNPETANAKTSNPEIPNAKTLNVAVQADRGRIEAVAFTPSGAIVTAGTERPMEIIDLSRRQRRGAHDNREAPKRTRIEHAELPARVLALAALRAATTGDEWLIAGGSSPADGPHVVACRVPPPDGGAPASTPAATVVVLDSGPALAVAAHGTLLAIGGGDGTLRLFDLAGEPDTWSARWVGRHRLGTPIGAVAFSPDGTRLATGDRGGDVDVWDISDPSRPHQIDTGINRFATWVNSVSFSPDGSRLAAGSSDGSVRVWSTNDWTPSATMVHHPSVVTDVVFLGPDRIATTCEDGAVRTFAVSPPDDRSIWSVSHTAAGDVVLAGTGTTVLVDRALATIERVDDEQFSGAADPLPDASAVLVGLRNGGVRLLALPSLATLDEQRTQAALVEYVAVSPDGQRAASIDRDGVCQLWSIGDRSIDDRSIGNWSIGDRSIGDWSIDPADSRGRLTPVGAVAVEPPGLECAFSADGSMVAITSESGHVTVATLATHSASRSETVLGVERLHVADGPAVSVRFHPELPVLVVGTADRTISVWRVSPGEEAVQLASLAGPTGNVMAVGFVPGGQLLAAGSTDGSVWLWRIDETMRTATQPELFATIETGRPGVYALDALTGAEIVTAGPKFQFDRWTLDVERLLSRVDADGGDGLTPAERLRYGLEVDAATD